MKKYYGKSISEKIVAGEIFCYKKQVYKVEKHAIIDIAGEIDRMEKALETAQRQLAQLYENALKNMGETHALIFDIHRMMLQDDDFLGGIKQEIASGCNAEYAVEMVGSRFETMFAAMDDEYMKVRAVDIKDISQRLIGILSGTQEEKINVNVPVILLAEDLSPSQMVKLNKSNILAVVTEKGSVNSHTAILAKSMNMPMIVNVPIDDSPLLHEKYAVVNGFGGEFIVGDKEDLQTEYQILRDKLCVELEALQQLKGKENITGDGRSIQISANIGSVSEVDDALESDAGGIGLLRSEFLYLGKEDFPTEDELFDNYRTIVEKMNGKKVIIRTLDVGTDKKADYFRLPTEENPAMGYRAIRFCLERMDIFETQLRAVYRASVYGTVAVMFPMITSVKEVKKIKEIVAQVKKQLLDEGYPLGAVELGIMIETPAAALIADELAREVEFFSIGTNDLTQYALAADRQNEKMESYYDSHHPAVLRLIKMTVESAHAAGIKVSICGELAADKELLNDFLDMGVDELSVASGEVLKVRKAIRDL